MKDDKLHKMVCSHCDSVEHFTSVPMEWRCDTCDYINGYSNKDLMNRDNQSVTSNTLTIEEKAEMFDTLYVEAVENLEVAGRKDDSGKLRYSLIPPIALEKLAGVLTFAVEVKNYIPNSWKTVPNAKERYLDALMRHIELYRSGEIKDSESNLPHMAHVLANASFLIHFDEEKNKKS